MKEVVLNDTEVRDDLFPFASIRHVADIRVGILTIREKWERLLNHSISLHTELPTFSNASIIPANIVPSKSFVSFLLSTGDLQLVSPNDNCKIIQYPWHIFEFNDWAIRKDFELIAFQRKSVPIPKNVQVMAPENIFIEEGAVLSACILNASTGPIYIGKNAEIMEGTMIRGPFALCEGSVVKMGARIYGATTVGPYSTVGGELKNTVIFGYSNKAHDGYLGDAVIGEWCNLGAGTSNSNLKNNAEEVRVWIPRSQKWQVAGFKCGLLMGDYSRSAINTSFNTGTVVGICSNVFGDGLTPAFIPDFSWGYKPIGKYQFEKAVRDISNWKKLKNKIVTEEESNQLRNIFNQS
jgi:UDP-N-acetylglucosamine diphosphorylase / glucose-1-phosphate thymidylyltransferase / UDP-N-acetylgalactosamine diphosphorylase / glucosamine-1-phosphate N-acetyltransferase / galactosamine-1-phosphate N-acetyltransferase